MSEVQLFDEANILFGNKEYGKALFLFSQLVAKFPNNKEYEVYVLMCDIATENDERGSFLFDYFTVTKNELGSEEAVRLTHDFISAYDGNSEKLAEILQLASTQEIESLEAINYKDFLELVRIRGSFKRAFEDIMFSTKVALHTKDEFYDFISKLIENNFSSVAYNYLDGYNEIFQYDAKFQELFKKLEEQNLDNHIR